MDSDLKGEYNKEIENLRKHIAIKIRLRSQREA